MGPLGWIFVGLVAGLVARIFVHTGRRFGCLGTILLGIVGSFVGGLLGSLLSGDGLDVEASGWIGSIVGAMVVLVIIRFVDSKD